MRPAASGCLFCPGTGSIQPPETLLNQTITAVAGLEAGHYTDLEHATGCTVFLCREGAVGGVDVRGGSPGTRETDLLRPVHRVDQVHAIVLSGGSAFGLDAASGVVAYLESQGIGYKVGRSEEHTSELQSRRKLVCRLLLEKKKEREHV